jgi:fructose transport system substrate-binding protein
MGAQVKLIAAGCLASLVLGTAAACSRGNGEDVVGLITKTDTNPYFVTMKKGAQAEAKVQGVDLQTFAGKVDGDNGPPREIRIPTTLIPRGSGEIAG